MIMEVTIICNPKYYNIILEGFEKTNTSAQEFYQNIAMLIHATDKSKGSLQVHRPKIYDTLEHITKKLNNPYLDLQVIDDDIYAFLLDNEWLFLIGPKDKLEKRLNDEAKGEESN